MKKIRPLGTITTELEPLLLEMTEVHQLQVGEVLNLIHGYLQIHCPGAFEVYEADGSSPTFFYGPRRDK